MATSSVSLPPPSESISDCISDSISAPNSDRIAPYALNRTRLAANLLSGAQGSSSDLVVTVNDGGANLNFKCSPGYFEKVANPCFTTLFSQVSTQRFEAQNINIGMPDPPVRDVDSTGLTETMVYKFVLSEGSSNLGNVTVHFHTTTQLVQVQGGRAMPDKRSAAVWFAELVLMPGLSQFCNRSDFKREEIKEIHEAIIKAFSKPLPPAPSTGQTQALPDLPPGGGQNCFQCLKSSNRFDGRSNPRPCLKCENMFHTDCLKKHSKSCSASLAVTTSSNTTTSSVILRPSVLTNVVQSYTPAGTGSGQEQLLGQLARLTAAPAPAAPPADLPPVSGAPSPSLLALAPARPPAAGPATRRPAQRRPGLQLTPEGLDKELLERELTAAKVKITSLDNRLSEEESRNKILLERIRMFENRETTAAYHQHFPPPAAAVSSPVSPPPAASPPASASPAPAPPNCASPSPAPPAPAASLSCCSASSHLIAQIDGLKCQVEDLHSAVAVLLAAAPHPSVQLPPSPPCPHGTAAAPPCSPCLSSAAAPSPDSPAVENPSNNPPAEDSLAPSARAAASPAAPSPPAPAPEESAAEALCDLLGLSSLPEPPARPHTPGSAHEGQSRRSVRRQRPAPRPAQMAPRRALLPTPQGPVPGVWYGGWCPPASGAGAPLWQHPSSGFYTAPPLPHGPAAPGHGHVLTAPQHPGQQQRPPGSRQQQRAQGPRQQQPERARTERPARRRVAPTVPTSVPTAPLIDLN